MTREEAIKGVKHLKKFMQNAMTKEEKHGIDMAIEALQTEPVKHGEWIERRFIHSREFKCSECGRVGWTNNINYCPNCGAKMDGGYDEK